MKTKKLNLNDLKVESFVTSLEGKKLNTVKGGTITMSMLSLSISVSYTITRTIDK